MFQCKKKILLVTHCFPPYALPEAYLSTKRMGNITDYSVDVLTINAFLPWVKKDESLTTYVDEKFSNITRIDLPQWYKRLPFHRFECFFSIPDPYVYLNVLYFKYLKDLSQYNIIMTWSMYHSVHLLGLYAKTRNKNISWIAHFSDPWTTNPFFQTTNLIRSINRYFERKVFAQADVLMFTSLETVDMVLKDYPDRYKEKTYVVPHAFDECFYQNVFIKNDKFVIRYLGSFYGARQPDSFLQALEILTKTRADILDKIQVEFIGYLSAAIHESLSNTLKLIVRFLPPVDYVESLRLMKGADLLLLIDAPFDNSPFLPSKLIDYIGANKPIFGITPPGTSQKLIKEMGFLTAHPNDPEEIAEKFVNAVYSDPVNINAELREKYSVKKVAKMMQEIFNKVDGGLI